MQIRQATRYFYGLALVLTVGTAAALWGEQRSARHAEEAVGEQIEFRQLGIDLAAASDHLTDEARRYTIFGDRKHVDAYWQEVKETRTRDRVVARLRELGAPESELDLIETAKRNSDALIAIEDQAMKAVEAGELETARDLMFSPEYDAEKAEIMTPIVRFQEEMNARAEAATVAARDRAQLMGVIAGVLALLTAATFFAVFYLFLGRRVVDPVLALTAVVERLAVDDTTIEVPHTDRSDEIGTLAKAIDVFKGNAVARRELESRQAEEQVARLAKSAAIEALMRRFDERVGGIAQTFAGAATELEQTAGGMTRMSSESMEHARVASEESEGASANVQTVASAAEELSSAIQEIGRQVASSTEIAGSAADEARRTTDQVTALRTAAEEINSVVELISSIAEQTNLLALNATIEAARAGEAGKGFAVVAAEVKALATQTARATDEIVQKIHGVQSRTGEAAEAIAGIAATVERINEVAASIAASVEQQGAATEEISRSAQSAANGTAQVRQAVERMTGAAQDTGAAASQVHGASGDLSRQAEALRAEVETLQAEILAA